MKQLILLTAMLLAMTAKLVAQNNKGLEVKNYQKQSTALQKELHQFELVANENVDVNLNFSLKTEDNLNIVVTDQRNRIVYTEHFKKAGQNKLNFVMEEEEHYTVKLCGDKQSNLTVQVSENQ